MTSGYALCTEARLSQNKLASISTPMTVDALDRIVVYLKVVPVRVFVRLCLT